MPSENTTPEQVSSSQGNLVTLPQNPLRTKYVVIAVLLLVVLVSGVAIYAYFLMKQSSEVVIEPAVTQPVETNNESALSEHEKKLAEEFDRITKEDGVIKPLTEEEKQAELDRITKEDGVIKPLTEEEKQAELDRITSEDTTPANTQ